MATKNLYTVHWHWDHSGASLPPLPLPSCSVCWWLGWSPGHRLSWHWLRIESGARHGGSSSWAPRNPPYSTAGVPLHEAGSVLRTPHHSGSPCPDISLPGAAIVGTETGPGHPPGRCPPCLPEIAPASLGLQGCGGERIDSSVSRPLRNRVPCSSIVPSLMAPCGLHLVLLASPSHSISSCPPAVLLTFVSTVSTQQTEFSQAWATPSTSI